MANELKASGLTSGIAYYAVIRNAAGLYYNNTTFVAYDDTDWIDYGVAAGEANTAGDWAGTFPAVAAGMYAVQLRERAAGSPDVADAVVGTGSMDWTGTAEATLREIKAKTDLLAGPVTSSGPVNPADGTLSLTSGDGYEVGTRVPSWTFNVADWPTMVGATATKLRFSTFDSYRSGATAPAVVVTDCTLAIDGATFTVKAPLTEANTALLVPGPPGGTTPQRTHRAQLIVSTAGGEDVTLLFRDVFVTRRVLPPA